MIIILKVWIKKGDIKHASKCTIEKDKDHSSKSEYSSLPSTDLKDGYNNKDCYINEDSMLRTE